MTSLGRVAALRVFPVKSTAGQALPSAAVAARGVVHDREWAVYTADGGIASGKTSARFRKVEGLMAWRSTVPADPDGVPSVHAPDGGCTARTTPPRPWR
jgi:uncharacterized protein YcbX